MAFVVVTEECKYGECDDCAGFIISVDEIHIWPCFCICHYEKDEMITDLPQAA